MEKVHMTCLTQAEIQAVADGAASSRLRQHAESCQRCLAGVREREMLTAAMVGVVGGAAEMPPRLVDRVEQALAAPQMTGATRFRSGPGRPASRRRAFWSAAAVAAATLAAVLFIAPLLKGPATVSAAEILAASANRLAQTATSGTEILVYELVLDGVPRDLMPDHADGTYLIRKAIDHDAEGRFRFTTYSADGTLLSSIAQDPVHGRRVVLVRVDDQPYRFEFTLPANTPLSLPEMERMHMQMSVAMMQASGNQHMQIIDTADGKAYRIEVPKVTGAATATSAVWDLSEARAVIDADDYRIVELAVKGTLLKQPYSVSFRLVSRDLYGAPGVPAEEFEVPGDPAAITLHGEGSAVPPRDALIVALREVAKARNSR